MTVGYIFWLVLTIIFTIIEFAIPALVTVWFAFAAALTVFVSLISDSMKVEITFFTVVSLLSIIFLRPYARAILSKNKDNFDAEKIDTAIIVKKIVESLPPHYVAVVPLDSYYNDTTELTDEERKAINFDHPDAFDWKLLIKQVNELREGKAVEQPTYSYILSNRLPETIHVEPKPVIIVEGIMALSNKRLRDMMDLKIFVDCDPDERLIRNIQRDTIDRGRTVSMVVDRYLEVLKPMHEQFIEPTKRYADVIIPQGGENVKGINILCKYIEGLMPGE